MLDGTRVIEMGLWVAGPATAGILADWGADVVKIEPPAGDPMRAFFRLATGSKVDRNPPFDLDNRGKRSVVLDVRDAGGRDAAYRLLAAADVFVTNFRPDALARLGFDAETLAARFPRLVYAGITGYGRTGPECDRPGYDVGAFWARSGVARTLAPDEAPPPQIRGGFGDHVTALATVAGILAALLERARSGRGRVVETSLLRTGAYCLGWDLGIQLAFGKIKAPVPRTEVETPLVNSYRAGCGRWFWLIGLEADRHFPGVARSVGREDLLADPRFAGARERRRECRALIAELDRTFATRPLAEWAERFDRGGVWWAPVQSLDEVVADPQARAAGAFVDVPTRDGGTQRAVASPVGFGGAPRAPRRPAPVLGADTEAVLREAGLDDAALAALRAEGVIPD
ncbi:MAG: CoA transferase [Deltaproteobacteria bacterium]|nr:CoA transferase [Deltaproteobacteria bacterium]